MVRFSVASKSVVTVRKIALIAIAIFLLPSNLLAETSQFQASLRLLEPISLTQKSALVFGDIYSGSSQEVTTAATDNNAVSFTASGQPNTAVTASIAEDSITLIHGNGDAPETQIQVSQFSTGGDLDSQGNAQFDQNGQLADLRVGATALIDASNIPGMYTAQATFRVVYN